MDCLRHQKYKNENTETKYLNNVQKKIRTVKTSPLDLKN